MQHVPSEQVPSSLTVLASQAGRAGHCRRGGRRGVCWAAMRGGFWSQCRAALPRDGSVGTPDLLDLGNPLCSFQGCGSSNKKLLGAPGIATSNKCLTSSNKKLLNLTESAKPSYSPCRVCQWFSPPPRMKRLESNSQHFYFDVNCGKQM